MCRPLTGEHRNPSRKPTLLHSNNVLHPEEDTAAKKLMMRCKMCNHKSEATDPFIYVNRMKKEAATRLDLVDTDLARDPTLPRTYETRCPKCKGKEAVFFMSRAGGKDSDMGLIFLCAHEGCLHKWLN